MLAHRLAASLSKDRKGTLSPECLLQKRVAELLRAQDSVLARLGDAELHNTLGRNLNLLAGCRVAADARLAIDEHELAETRKCEAVLCVLVGKVSDRFQDLRRLTLRDIVFFGDGRRNL